MFLGRVYLSLPCISNQRGVKLLAMLLTRLSPRYTAMRSHAKAWNYKNVRPRMELLQQPPQHQHHRCRGTSSGSHQRSPRKDRNYCCCWLSSPGLEGRGSPGYAWDWHILVRVHRQDGLQGVSSFPILGPSPATQIKDCLACPME